MNLRKEKNVLAMAAILGLVLIGLAMWTVFDAVDYATAQMMEPRPVETALPETDPNSNMTMGGYDYLYVARSVDDSTVIVPDTSSVISGIQQWESAAVKYKAGHWALTGWGSFTDSIGCILFYQGSYDGWDWTTVDSSAAISDTSMHQAAGDTLPSALFNYDQMRILALSRGANTVSLYNGFTIVAVQVTPVLRYSGKERGMK